MHSKGGIRQEGKVRGNDKTVGNRDIRKSVEGRGMGWGTRGIQHGHYRDFQEGIREFEGGAFGLRLPLHSHLVFACVLYHRPNSDDSTYVSLSDKMDQLLSSHHNLFLICGDFNWLGVGTSLHQP